MDIRHAVGVKLGVPAEKLADVMRYRESPRFSERERAALQFCERITRDDLEVSEECLARVREHFTETEIVELTFIIGYQTFASKGVEACTTRLFFLNCRCSPGPVIRKHEVRPTSRRLRIMTYGDRSSVRKGWRRLV